jgi:histidinol-phosphate aminotransferase
MIKTPLSRLIPAYVRDFEPYRPMRPDQELLRFYGVERLCRLHNNENLLGPSPAALEAMARVSGNEAASYPSGDAYYLRRALAELHGKDPEQFVPGNGVCEIIPNLVRAFCERGDNILTADKTFALYEWSGQSSGVETRLIPLHPTEHCFDELALLEAIDRRSKLLFLCNPNNPTGKYWPREKLVRFLDAIGGRLIVVLDEAYAEYVEREDYASGLELLREYDNLVVLRSFSKIYGLSGLRVGYACAAERVLTPLRSASVVYSVNRLAQGAAVAALRDTAHLRATRTMTEQAKTFVLARLAKLGLPAIHGEGNFLIARVPLSDTLLARKMLLRGYLVRPMSSFRFPNWIRLTLGPLEMMEGFCGELEAALGLYARPIKDCHP